MTQQPQIAGIPWYEPENFDRLRSMFEDGNKLHGTYEEWRVAAESSRKNLESRGVRVVCVNIDPDQFPVWCRDNRMNLNAEARNRFAASIAYKLVSASGQNSTH